MKKIKVIGGVLFLVMILVFSVSIPTPAFSTFLPKKTVEKNDQFLYENTFDAKKMFKQVIFGSSNEKNDLMDFFTSTIKTSINNIQQTTQLTYGVNNEIDVDNNQNTGINGKDIRVQYLLLPYLLSSPDLRIGLEFSVIINRIGDEIKDDAFSLSASIANEQISVGYTTADEGSNEIPKRMELSSILFLQLTDSTIGFSWSMDPTYEANQQEKQIHLTAGFSERSFSFGFKPASRTQITIQSTNQLNKWSYLFTKESSFDTVFTADMTKKEDGETKQTRLTIDSIPNEISFDLALTPFSSAGGSIQYQSSTMYDVSVLVETDSIGQCKYAIIENTPRRLSAEWIPSKENGFYHLDLDSDGTTISLLNTLQNPTINISIQELSSTDMTAFWNLSNPGNLNIIKNPSLQLNLDVIFDEWTTELRAKPTAENIYFSWKSNLSGYLTFDTDQQPLNTIDLLVTGPVNGIALSGNTLSADNFHLDWTVWPIEDFFVTKSGSMDFFSLSIDVYVNGVWYHLWPLL